MFKHLISNAFAAAGVAGYISLSTLVLQVRLKLVFALNLSVITAFQRALDRLSEAVF